MKYFILDSNSQQQGPFTIYELKDRGINEQTLVWAEGMENWQPAWQVEEIKRLLFDQPAGTPPPPPHSTDSFSQTTPRQPMSPQPQQSHRALIAGIIIAVVVLVVLAITNPDRRQHTDAIARAFTEAFDNEMDKSGISDSALGEIGNMIADRMTASMVDQLLDYHNYIIFSKSTITIVGKSYTVSWGLLGRVFTVSNDRLSQKLEKRLHLPTIDRESTVVKETTAPDGTTSIDSTTVSRKGAEKIVDGVSDIVKDQVEQNTDSSTSSTINKLIDDVKSLLN
ncbi:MAG: GYF domain-containing protein [Prevotella sp.]|nr:GYF domain-containing protein [Prevotella sp.]